MRMLWQLFSSFFRIGLLTFGGGYSMLPMLQREIVQKHGWVPEDELLDYFAIGQCIPGVIAVNTATFVGCRMKGWVGGIVAMVGVVVPSLAIITAIAALLQNFMELEWIQHMFAGIRVAVAALILSTVVRLVRQTLRHWYSIVLCAAAFLIIAFFGVSPIWIVVTVLALGLLLVLTSRKGVSK